MGLLMNGTHRREMNKQNLPLKLWFYWFAFGFAFGFSGAKEESFPACAPTLKPNLV